MFKLRSMRILDRQKPPVPYKYIYLVAVVFSLVVILQSSTTSESGEMQIELKHIVLFSLNYIVWALLINWIYGLYQQIDTIPNTTFFGLVKVLVSALLLIAIHVVISNVAFYLFLFIVTEMTPSRALTDLMQIIDRVLISRSVDLLVILGVLKGIDTYRVLQKRKLQVVELENQLHISQLESLKAQLNPHFLFNALHALNTLIGHDDTKAKSMVIKISGLLRKMLDNQDRHTVTLKEELDYLQDYLEIEQERFHDRLTLRFDIDEQSKTLVVPALMLQPLAENAFKHGISLIEDEGSITLKSKASDELLSIEMSNSVPPDNVKSSAESTNLGLSNLRNRLEQLYGSEFTLETKKSRSVFTVTITITQNQ